MNEQKKVRELIKPQRVDQNELNGGLNQSLVVPYCGSGYSSGQTTSCASGYSSNAWCVSTPTPEDDVLF
ncbi:hypothetical protein [Mucilaginibacter sp. KACC 22063]|uniref:hypothetical protein n=1 Tax=Mucilaginibacter sp. KACC 22063 TaxID=3025666 RepID=UPI0023656B48|nr:hypothetical protein [Mucilaginibacter sp. KACC 22063]WDF56223.1 hypothetical protein PQ461_04010 [Mucilaginibacter sp. KACC 22063]